MSITVTYNVGVWARVNTKTKHNEETLLISPVSVRFLNKLSYADNQHSTSSCVLTLKYITQIRGTGFSEKLHGL